MTRLQVKATKHARATAALQQQLTADVLFLDMATEYRKLKGSARVQLGIALAPCFRPELKSSEITARSTTTSGL
ncbi:MAG: hypothetical protein ABJI96_10345 [Paracoccaceae bacterium]